MLNPRIKNAQVLEIMFLFVELEEKIPASRSTKEVESNQHLNNPNNRKGKFKIEILYLKEIIIGFYFSFLTL